MDSRRRIVNFKVLYYVSCSCYKAHPSLNCVLSVVHDIETAYMGHYRALRSTVKSDGDWRNKNSMGSVTGEEKEYGLK